MVVRTVLSRDTFSLPELAPFLGQEVEIRLAESPRVGPAVARPLTPDEIKILDECWAELSESGYDFDAIARQDAVDIADQKRQWGLE